MPKVSSPIDRFLIDARFKALPKEAKAMKFKTTTAYCRSLLENPRGTVGPMTLTACRRWIKRHARRPKNP